MIIQATKLNVASVITSNIKIRSTSTYFPSLRITETYFEECTPSLGGVQTL